MLFPIFITPDGIDPNSEEDAERYVPVGYDRIAGLIDRTLRTRGSNMSTAVSGFLEQYARTLRRHAMTDADNIDELALQIYNKHRAAIDMIIKARPALEAKGWDVLDSALARYEPFLRGDGNSKWYHQFYVPEPEGIPELREGQGWTESGRVLLFEVKYKSRALALVVGPGPEATRRRLYNLSEEPDMVPGVTMRRTQKLSPTFHTSTAERCWGRQVHLSPTTRVAGTMSRPRLQPFSTTTTGPW